VRERERERERERDGAFISILKPFKNKLIFKNESKVGKEYVKK